jgi:protein MpaA
MIAHLLSACAATPSSTNAAPPFRPHIVGQSLQNRSIECITIGDAAAPIRVMFIATIHGDEPAGTPLLQNLVQHARLGPQWMRDRLLIVIPIANPDGLALHRRGNARGIDLNRNFPAASFAARRRHGEQPLSEPESGALHDLILAHTPDRIITIHQPLACIDYDGPGRSLAESMFDAIEPEHRLRIDKLGAYPGSLGSFAGEDLGIPTITIEFSATVDQLSAEILWQRYGPMLIAAVRFDSNVTAAAPASDPSALADK